MHDRHNRSEVDDAGGSAPAAAGVRPARGGSAVPRRRARPHWPSLIMLVVSVLAAAATAHAQVNGVNQRRIQGAVRGANALLERWSGTQLEVAFPPEGPIELTIDVDAHPGLVQIIDAQAADPPNRDRRATARVVVSPTGNDLAATFDDPPDWDRPIPLSVLARPAGKIEAVFWDPPDWDKPTPLQVLTGPTGDIEAAFWDDPPDWDTPTPLKVLSGPTGGIQATFWDPPDWDMPRPLVVRTGPAGEVEARFWDPPDWDRPSPMTVRVGAGQTVNVVVDSAAIGNLNFTDTEGNQYMLVPVTAQGDTR